MLLQIALVIVAIVALMIIGVPIGFAFGIGGMVMMFIFNVDPGWAIPNAFDTLMSFAFLALPLYLLLGVIVGNVGMADKISDFVVSLIGRLRGGLGVALIVTNGVFGAISGVALSALAGIGKSFLPSMKREGYPIEYTTALLVCSAVLAILIPPSGNMITFGFMSKLPISHCFLAPAIPGVILMFFLSLVHLVMCRKIPTIHVLPKAPFKQYARGVMRTGYSGSLTLLLPVIVLGGIYGGIYTPAEAASVGIFYAIIVGMLIYRSVGVRGLGDGLLETGMTIGSIIALFFFFIVISKVFILLELSNQILAVMMTVSTNRWVLMGMLNILMLIMGMIMDDGSATMIAAIILLPIARSIGFDPYHFAAICGVNLGLGMITPPVAPLLYVGGAIAGNLPLNTYIKPVVYYIIFAYLPTLAITIAFPVLSTYLPYLLMKGA